jgi:fructose-1,6-bisphosphatase/inositol monophosphatase family enzyme
MILNTYIKTDFNRFIAEESAANNVLTTEPTWILDPIDGTTNFVQSFPFCCISLALAVENDLKLGIIYNPILNQLFTAQKGKGAYLNNEKIQVTNTEGNQIFYKVPT